MSSNMNVFHLDVYSKMKELLPELDYIKDPEKFISLEILAKLSNIKQIISCNLAIVSDKEQND